MQWKLQHWFREIRGRQDLEEGTYYYILEATKMFLSWCRSSEGMAAAWETDDNYRNNKD